MEELRYSPTFCGQEGQIQNFTHVLVEVKELSSETGGDLGQVWRAEAMVGTTAGAHDADHIVRR